MFAGFSQTRQLIQTILAFLKQIINTQPARQSGGLFLTVITCSFLEYNPLTFVPSGLLIKIHLLSPASLLLSLETCATFMPPCLALPCCIYNIYKDTAHYKGELSVYCVVSAWRTHGQHSLFNAQYQNILNILIILKFSFYQAFIQTLRCWRRPYYAPCLLQILCCCDV